MNKEKFSPKILKTVSPKSSIKRHKSPKSSLGSPKVSYEKEKLSETDYLKKAIHLLSEEKNMLYEYKLMAVPKINSLEAQLEKTKSLYESEISCLQEYVNLLKSNNPQVSEDLQEQLKAEKNRSLTFYRALMRKQNEFDEMQEKIENAKRIENSFKKIIEENKSLTKEIEENKKRKYNEQRKSLEMSPPKKKNDESEKLRDLMEILKNDLQVKMNTCVDQVVSNFNVFSNKMNKLDEKIKTLEKNQNGLNSLHEKIQSLNKGIESLKKEKIEVEKKAEKDYISRLKDITSYADANEKYEKTIKSLTNEIEKLKISYESKIKIFIKENKDLKSSILKLEEITNENNELKIKVNDLNNFLENKVEKDKINKLLQDKNQLTKKLNELNGYINVFEEKLKRIETEKEQDLFIIANKNKIIDELKQEVITLSERANKTDYSPEEKLQYNTVKSSNHLKESSNNQILEREIKTSAAKVQNFEIDYQNELLFYPTKKSEDLELSNLKEEYKKLESIIKDQENVATLLFTTNEELIEKEKEIEDIKKIKNEEIEKLLNQINKIHAEHAREVEILNQELDEINENNYQEIQEINQNYEAEIQEIKEKHQKFVQDLEKSHKSEIKVLQVISIKDENYRLKQSSLKSSENSLSPSNSPKNPKNQIKSLQNELFELKTLYSNEHTKNLEISKELDIAKSIIFNYQSSLDVNESIKFKEIEDSIHDERRKSKRLEKDLDFHSTLLTEEKKRHEETVRALLEADKKCEEMGRNLEELKMQLQIKDQETKKKILEAEKDLVKKVKDLESSIIEKDKEIENLREKVKVLCDKCKELACSHQEQLEYYEQLLNDLSAQEDLHLKDLHQMQEYEKTIAENLEKLEENRVTIEELHEIIEDFKQDIQKSEVKVKNLEETVKKLTHDFSKHLDKKNQEILKLHRKLVMLKNIEKDKKSESFSMKSEEKPKFNSSIESIENLRNSREDYSESVDKSFRKSIKESCDKLKTLNKELVSQLVKESVPGIDKIQKILSNINQECEENVIIVSNSLSFEELYESLIREYEEYKEVTEDLEQRLDFLTSENTKLYNQIEIFRAKNEDLQKKINENEIPAIKINDSEELVTFESISLEKKCSGIDYNEKEYQEKIKTLQEENERLKKEIELLKENFSSLQYSASEEEPTHKKSISDDFSKNWKDDSIESIDFEDKKIKKIREDILILDHDEDSNDDDEVSSPNVQEITEDDNFAIN